MIPGHHQEPGQEDIKTLGECCSSDVFISSYSFQQQPSPLLNLLFDQVQSFCRQIVGRMALKPECQQMPQHFPMALCHN